jgi:hypothetical protein
MALIVGSSGVVSITVAATTTPYLLAGEFEVSIENSTTEKGPWIGDANVVDVAAGRKYSFKVSGDLGVTAAVANNDTWFNAILAGYTSSTLPDTLTLTSTGGKSFAFAEATTTYTKLTYTHNAADGVSFSAEGTGVPTIT